MSSQAYELDFALRPRLSWALRVAFFFTLLTANAPAQYRFEVFNSEKGLPQNSVYSILQTRDGYLWFTTLDGLVRYDGARFKVFSTANSPGIKSNRFTRLFEDRQGRLWLCSEDGGVTEYANGRFTTYTTADGLPDNHTYSVREDAGGHILVQTHGGAARLEAGRFTVPFSDLQSFDAVAGYEGKSGAIWYRLDTQLKRVKDGKVSAYDIPAINADGRFYPQLFEDQGGKLWIGSNMPELVVLENEHLTRYTPADGLPAAPVVAFYQTADGTLWLGTNGAGLATYRDGKFTTFTTRDGLPSNQIMAIYQDREGTIWAGTADGGLVQLNRHIITSYADRDSIPARSYYPVMESSDGCIWAGDEGLFRIKDGAVSHYALTISPNARKYRSSYKDITALYEDRDGSLWIGSDVDLFKLKDGKFSVETYSLGPDFSQTGFVFAILRDSEGNLWVGTSHGLIKQRDGAAKLFTTADGLAGDEVHALLEDRDGSLWIGSYGGLTHLSNGGFTPYTEREGLSGHQVRTIYQDSQGTVWVGSYDGGLSRFQDGRFTRYTTAEGLFSNGVFQILEDDAGNFWMSSNRGIFRVSRGQLNDFADGKVSALDSISYGVADGMPTAECNGGRQPAGFKGRDGRLWFPTVGGLAVVDPRVAPPNLTPPPVLIESAYLLGKELETNANEQKGNASATANAAGSSISQMGVRLLPGQQGLEIRYQGLSFIKPDHVRFRYKMDGLDPDWIEAGGNRSAFYPHIPPGHYLFRVIAANSDGIWNETGATLVVRVLPYFWQTTWFTVVVVLTILGLGGLGYRYRIRQLTRAKKTQEEFSRRLIYSQESERKRIAAELHDSLNQSLVIIKNRAALSLNSPEDPEHAFEQLEEIADAATRAIDEVRDIAYTLRPFQLDRLGLTKSIESMALKVSSTGPPQLTAEVDPIDGLLSKESEASVYRIIQESVNNMLKHARATEASVTVRHNASEILLTIRDNGTGFAPPRNDAYGDGFGLAGMNERVRILGGVMTIDSAPGRGAAIIVRIPVPT